MQTFIWLLLTTAYNSSYKEMTVISSVQTTPTENINDKTIFNCTWWSHNNNNIIIINRLIKLI